MKEIQDQAIDLEHLQSILPEFAANIAFGEGQLGQTFYNGLRPTIKLWIANVRKDMYWDDLIRVANKAEARAKVQKNTHLDQHCPKGKQPLKISINSCDNQDKNTKAISSHSKTSSLIFDQSKIAKKAKKKK